jgi:hypothetical protein
MLGCYHFVYLIWCYVSAYTNIVYLVYSSICVRDKKQKIIGVGDFIHTLTDFGKCITEDLRARTNRS